MGGEFPDRLRLQCFVRGEIDAEGEAGDRDADRDQKRRRGFAGLDFPPAPTVRHRAGDDRRREEA